MKILSALLVICLMMFGITACGNNADEGKDGTVENNQSADSNVRDDVEDGVDDTTDAIDDATDSVTDGVDDVTDDMLGNDDTDKNDNKTENK